MYNRKTLSQKRKDKNERERQKKRKKERKKEKKKRLSTTIRWLYLRDAGMLNICKSLNIIHHIKRGKEKKTT